MVRTKYFYIRNVSRILGLIACLFYIFISVKGGLAQVIQGTGNNLIPFFPYLAISIAGYLIAYVQERKGGIIMLVGGSALFVFFYDLFGWSRLVQGFGI
ncbi:MAG: hypothetical protein HC905_09870 [Bacteroidales bacterium]|nr:hypothetical protein [Bacteroidales bacterium]